MFPYNGLITILNKLINNILLNLFKILNALNIKKYSTHKQKIFGVFIFFF